MKNLLSILFFLLLLSQTFYAQREPWDPQNLSVQTPIQVTYETGGVSDFVWSPDGNQFAYIATYNDTARLYRINVVGSNKIELTSNAFGNIDWKDNVIVFKANDPQAPPYYNILLKKINPDGSGMSTIIGPYWYHGVYLRSDANWILYERAPGGWWIAMRCDLNGGNELEVSHSGLVQQVGWLGRNQILYSRGDDYYTPCGIHKVNFNGSGYVQLTPENLPNNATFIACPDTSKILYCDGTANSWDIWIMNADGSNKTQLTSDPAKDYISNTRDNIWSADGQSFYFVSERSGNGDIYRQNIDGSGLTQIASHDSLDYVPIPSPDGTKLAFISKRDGVKNIWVIDLITVIEVEILTPVEYALEQNYPNPFNPVTVLKYSLPVKNVVTLKVFNLLGEEVTTLVNEIKEAGSYEVNFNANGLPSGIYFYRIKAGNFVETKKMVLLK